MMRGVEGLCLPCLRQTMPNIVSTSFSRGWGLVQKNPQIFYTVFVAVVIVIGFLFTSQLFVDIVVDTQERFERFRLSSMHDAFVPLAEQNLSNTSFLTAVIEDIHNQNEAIESFRVVVPHSEERSIVASLDATEIGKIDPEDDAIYQFTYIDPE